MLKKHREQQLQEQYLSALAAAAVCVTDLDKRLTELEDRVKDIETAQSKDKQRDKIRQAPPQKQPVTTDDFVAYRINVDYDI